MQEGVSGLGCGQETAGQAPRLQASWKGLALGKGRLLWGGPGVGVVVGQGSAR